MVVSRTAVKPLAFIFESALQSLDLFLKNYMSKSSVSPEQTRSYSDDKRRLEAKIFVDSRGLRF